MTKMSRATLRTCSKGHQYYKSSDCPTCPVCESERVPEAEFLALVSAPARRGLESAGILTLERLSEFSEQEVLRLHGVGPSAIPKLKAALQREGLTFTS